MSSVATTPLLAEPFDRQEFSARLDFADLGQFTIGEIRSTASIVRHSREHAAIAREPRFLVALQLEDACRFRQMGRDTLLQSGDLALFDSTLPFDVVTSAPHGLLVLGIPHLLLRKSIACPEIVLGLRLRGDAELSGLVSRFIRSFWFDYRNRLDAAPLPRITVAILDLIASAYSPPAARSESSSASTLWRVRIKEYIEAHLDEPELSPAQVAAALRISTGYLHRLFHNGDETVVRHVQNRRLEECAQALTDPAQHGRTVTEIALSRGFSNLSHFSRVFRARYGTSPREYRAAHSKRDSFRRQN
jgi:AraC-like DNA-binding protein